MQLSDIGGVTKRELRDVLDDIQDVVARVTPLDEAQLVRLRGELGSSLRSVAQRIDAGIRPARARVGDLLGRADALVRERPWTVTLAAVLIGVAIGAGLRRRTRRTKRVPVRAPALVGAPSARGRAG